MQKNKKIKIKISLITIMKQIMVYYLNGESFNRNLMRITFENNESINLKVKYPDILP